MLFSRLAMMMTLVIKRMTAQPWLALANLLCMVVIFAMTISIPVYADAVYHRMFSENLLEGDLSTDGAVTAAKVLPSEATPNSTDAVEEAVQKPPFALLLRASYGNNQLKGWQEIESVNHYLLNEASAVLGLPQRMGARFIASPAFGLYPGGQVIEVDARPILETNLAVLKDVEGHIILAQGRFPSLKSAQPGAPVEILISEGLSEEAGIQVGEEYTALFRVSQGGKRVVEQVRLVIAGTWRAADPTEPFWYVRPEALHRQMLVREEALTRQVGAQVPENVSLISWYLVMDQNAIRYREINALLNRLVAMQRTAETELNGLTLQESPVKALQRYHDKAEMLVVQLVAVSTPAVGLLLVFVNLIASLSIQQRRNEIAVLRSRGVSTLQVTGMILLENVLLAGISFVISIPLAIGAARMIGKTRSFLDFSLPVEIPVALTSEAIGFGLVATLLVLLFQTLPAYAASKNTIISYRRDRARALGKPAWHRAGLDLLLFIPAAYGAYLLPQQNTVAAIGSRNLFENPLLFLVPMLSIFSLALFYIRLMPALMAALVWLSRKTPSVGILFAATQLARSPGIYTAPLLLLILTLGMSGFVTSLSQTIDRHLYDQVYYRVGADVTFYDAGLKAVSDPLAAGMLEVGGQSQPEGVGRALPGTEKKQTNEYYWGFLPPEEYGNYNGVVSVTRVGTYQATTQVAGVSTAAKYMGIDHADFAQTAFWMEVFSQQSLAELMNSLANTPDGVLIPEGMAHQGQYQEGDMMQVSVSDETGLQASMDLRVAGSFRYFPGWYPEDGLLLVGNLDHLYEQAGGQFPRQVWFKTRPGVEAWAIGEQRLRSIPIRLLGWSAARPIIQHSQELPERQGLFGLLSVSFVSAAVLTALSFFIYALFTFRQRFIEMGVLRAIGLSIGQMTVVLSGELALLVLPGGLIGTLLGIGASEFFVPYFQIFPAGSTEAASSITAYARAAIPPYVVQIAWEDIFRVYALYGLMFLAALAGLFFLLRRIQIFQAIKLGETT